MEINLFNKAVEIKTHYCQLYDEPLCKIDIPYINLYIQFRDCNANCRFCIYKKTAQEFNTSKFIETLSQLKEQIEIRKISITGGEPTLNYKFLKNIVKHIKDISPDSFKVINTNGLHLEDMFNDNFAYEFDSISLSRHHFNDSINNKIFGFNTPSRLTIKEIQKYNSKKDLIHFSCNIMKGYIDNQTKILQYLEEAANIGVYDVGFVTLMKVNDWATEHFFDFDDIEINSNRFHTVREWKHQDSCKCKNYLYIPDDLSNGPVKAYSRRSIKDPKQTNIIVWDGQYLKIGFNGLILK